MNAGISEQEFKQIRDYIEEHCGISLGQEKAYLVESRLTKLMIQSGCDDFAAFYRFAKNQPNNELRDKIVDAITTNETLWFRDKHPYVILREKILPELAQEIRAGKRQKVRVWSAASSTGQEAYSIALTIEQFCKENPGVRREHFEIVGTDISPSALFVASSGRYDQIAISRGLPEDLRDKYFKHNGRVWEIDAGIKSMTSFKKFNLQTPPDGLGRFDVVFLRYVAIYFADSFKRKLFGNLARVLAPSGWLFIGAVESLRGYSTEFDLLSHAGGAYYRRKG